MDSTLSLEEFERLHNQLLELKSINYSLDDRCKKNLIEINSLKESNENLKKELTKLQNVNKLNPLSFARNLALSKSLNNDKEIIEKLISENESYQRKINSQEDDFKITNQTLRTEILNLMNYQKQLEQQIEELNKEKKSETDLNNCENENSKLSYLILAEKEELNLQILELTQANQILKQKEEKDKNKLIETKQQLEQLQNDYDSIVSQCSKANSLADNRKSIIDEMKLYIDEISLKQNNEMKIVKKELDEFKMIIENLKKENNVLLQELNEYKILNEKLVSIQRLAQLCYNNCKIFYQTHHETKEYIKQYVNRFREEEDKAIMNIKNMYENVIKEWKEKWKTLQSLNQNNEKELIIAKQKISDELEERRIHERKGIMVVKELKRELNSEKKRADKLQEKLEEILNEKSSSSIVMDITLNNQNNDSSSVGSWSFMSNKEQVGGECNVSQYSESDLKDISSNNSLSNTEVPNQKTTTALLEQENSKLVSRVTKLQQEKWFLEEKINHLEMVNGELAEDIAKKKEVIAFYCMEGRSDPYLHNIVSNTEKITVKRVVDFIKEKGDGNLKEINRKLQRMLEETLTRNMHLQKDMETLSKEIERLNKS